MICQICDKRRLVGNQVSHSNIKTKKQQHANVQRRSARIAGRQRWIQICTRCIRSGRLAGPQSALKRSGAPAP